MNIFWIILGALILTVAIFALYRFIKVRIQYKRSQDLRLERVKPLVEKLENNQQLTRDDVRPFAEDLLAREITYEFLKNHKNLDLFPEEFNTIVKGAESHLANWLEFPTELDVCPDEIEHLQRVTIDYDGDDNFVHYEVFRYRTNEPHWAAKDGWILGVVGPYFDDSKPYDFAQSTFSRIISMSENSDPEAEAKWVHQNISMREWN